MVSFVVQKLYGGALTSELPEGLVDASQFRQVPDTQEVFLNPTENTKDYTQLNKDDSIIFDLMEKIEGKDDNSALKEHFAEISSLNSTSNNWELVSIEQTANKINFKSYVGVGIEPALKWGRDESSGDQYKPTLVVVLGLIRIDKVSTDVLITFNVLISREDELKDLQQLQEKGYNSSSPGNLASQRLKLATEVVRKSIASFTVENWELFG